jgi:hypothetical protein
MKCIDHSKSLQNLFDIIKNQAYEKFFTFIINSYHNS